MVTTTTARTPRLCRTASNTWTVPITFVAYVPIGSRYPSRTSACAAMWITTSASARRTASATAPASRTSAIVVATSAPTPARSNRFGTVGGVSA